MDCNEAKSNDYPILMCFFQTGNEEQKNYCIKIKDNFQHSKPIRFEIKSMPDSNFLIQFKIKGNVHKIQEVFNDTTEAMNESLNKMYKILDESK